MRWGVVWGRPLYHQGLQLAAGPARAYCRSQRYVRRQNTASKYRRRQTALRLNCSPWWHNYVLEINRLATPNGFEGSGDCRGLFLLASYAIGGNDGFTGTNGFGGGIAIFRIDDLAMPNDNEE